MKPTQKQSSPNRAAAKSQTPTGINPPGDKPQPAQSSRFFLFAFWLAFAFTVVYFDFHFFKFIFQHHTLLFESGEFKSDRYINIAMARFSTDHGPNFMEPYGRQYPIFYQFLPYWIVGMLSAVFAVQPWVIANLSHIFFPPAFFLVMYFLAKKITGNRWHALLASVLLFFFGSLEALLTNSTDIHVYAGIHAVILTFTRASYGFYLDMYSILFGCIALILLLKHLGGKSKSVLTLAGFCTATFLCFVTHYLPALLFTSIFYCLILRDAYLDMDEKKRNLAAKILYVTGGLYALALVGFHFILPMRVAGMLAAIPYAIIFVMTRKRRDLILMAILFSVCAIVPALNVLSLFKDGNPVFNYTEEVRTKQLSIPPLVFVLAYFPILIPAIYHVLISGRKGALNAKTVMFIVSIVWIFNGHFGYNNHPYRFIPFAMPILMALAIAGIFDLWTVFINTTLRNRISPVALGGIKFVFISGFSLMLLLGIGFNLHRYAQIATANDQLPDPKSLEVAELIGSISKKNPDSVFLVSPRLPTVDSIAPYTSAKFFYCSNIGLNPNWRAALGTFSRLTSLVDIRQVIQAGGYKISYLVEVKGLRDVQEKDVILEKNGVVIIKL